MESLDNEYFQELNDLIPSYIPQAKYGILNVGLSKVKNTATGYRWTYVYYDNTVGKLRYFGSYDLRKLRQKVLENGFDWIIIDNRKAIDTYKLNNKMMEDYDSSSTMNLKLSRKRNSTGFYRVHLNKGYRYRKGYNWHYRYYIKGKPHILVSKDLLELRRKVSSEGLEWIVVDKDKARESAFLDGYDLEELM